ncbi:MAG: isocitrate lyase/PEP mutase family protein [Isosphaeraceae bacterium]
MSASAPRQLRLLLEDSTSRLVFGAYDAMTARIGEAGGAEILAVTGFGVAATLAGLPDIGLVSMSESVDVCRRVCDAVDVPVIADADTGYGNALSVRRTVRAFEAAGAAGLHLEDQVAPKRCGHMPGPRVISTEEMLGKISAAVDARRDADFCIVARTDARAAEGFTEALERGHAYQEAGADLLFVEALQEESEIEQVAREFSCPLIFNWSYDGVTPHVSRQWLAEIGYKLILFPDVVFAAHRALAAFAGDLMKADSLDLLGEKMSGFDEFNEFIGLEKWRTLESRYVPNEALSPDGTPKR